VVPDALAHQRPGDRLRQLHARLVALSPVRVLGTLVVAQWILVLGLALVVRHAGWIYYQGGDQLWYYTIGWGLAHGHVPQPGVGYLWAVLLAPIAAVTGPNIANAYPAIIVVQFLFLLPAALLALYGIASRVGGRLFGYWTAALWIVVPLVAIKYTDAGYHARFTEALLPQGFGLTAMGDFPSMVATIVACYFCARVIADEPNRTVNAIASGLAAGAAFAIKPATALFLAGPVLGLLVARRHRSAGWFLLALGPAAVALAFVKWRGFGYLPLFHSAAGVHLAAGDGGPTVLAADPLQHYLHFNRHVFLTQLDQVREHFWSLRLVEWLVLGGLIGLFVKSRPFGALVLGWFFPIVLVKTGSGRADFEGGSLLRVIMPAYPAFVLMLAALPFLLPGVARRWTSEPGTPPRPLLSARARTTALVAAVVGTAVVPMAAWAVAKPIRGGPAVLPAAILQQPPIPLGVDLGLHAQRAGEHVTLTWRAQHPAGGPVFYTVFRQAPGTTLYACNAGSAAQYCALTLTNLGTTRATTWSDPKPLAGSASYYVGVTANWLNDLTQGDVYVLSSGARSP
jgi:hypothetical protein